jgi:hypothetical protein
MPTVGQYEVDHIIPARIWTAISAVRDPDVSPSWPRFGPNHLDNFAWTCSFCNIAKGHQITGRSGRRRYRLYNPRTDRWRDHFAFFHGHLLIIGLPGIGQATERVLRFNDGRLEGPIGTRHEAIMAGRYPPAWARDWMGGRQR